MSDKIYNPEEETDSFIKRDLPESTMNKLTFDQLIQTNKEYQKLLSKLAEKNIVTRKPSYLSKSDMKVLNNLLQENFEYMIQILTKPIYKVELDNLYTTSISILNSLSQFTHQHEILLYQKLEKLKFMELKFHSLRMIGSKDAYIKADSLLEEIENIQNDQSLQDNISLINIATILLYKGLTKFYLEDFENAEKYGIDALDLLEKKGFGNNSDEEENKQVKCMSQILEFLVELYDLKKDYKSALSCYDKAYYLNIGKYGVKSEMAQQYKRKKDIYQNSVNNKNLMENYNTLNQNYYYNENDYYYNNDDGYNNDFVNRKLIQGNIANAKGTAETFSFKIPVTKNVEPMIISLYALSEDPNVDRFASELFLKNLYLDKTRLFNILGIKNQVEQQNYMLYTDDAINDILQNIQVDEENSIFINDPSLLSAVINC